MTDSFEDDLSRSVGPWVVEWCSMGPQKGIWHIDTLKDALRHNLRTFKDNDDAKHSSQWIILGITETAREANELIDKIKAMRFESAEIIDVLEVVYDDES